MKTYTEDEIRKLLDKLNQTIQSRLDRCSESSGKGGPYNYYWGRLHGIEDVKDALGIRPNRTRREVIQDLIRLARDIATDESAWTMKNLNDLLDELDSLQESDPESGTG